MSPTSLVLGKGLKFLPLSWASACLNEQDPCANLRLCFSASETKSSANVHKSLCIRVCLALHHHLLISSLQPPAPPPPIMQLLKSLTSLSEFASNPYYCEKIIGSDSSPGYMRKVKTPQCENVAIAMNHQTICSFTDSTSAFRKHKAA